MKCLVVDDRGLCGEEHESVPDEERRAPIAEDFQLGWWCHNNHFNCGTLTRCRKCGACKDCA